MSHRHSYSAIVVRQTTVDYWGEGRGRKGQPAIEHKIMAVSPSLATDQTANRGVREGTPTPSCAGVEITMWYA